MKPKKILLVNPPAYDLPQTYFGPPYGLSLIAASLREKGRIPICLDLERSPLKEAGEQINKICKKESIGYIGISIQSANRGNVYDLVNFVRKSNKDIIIILGGPFATEKHELLLRSLPIDYIVLDEGHITFPELIVSIENKSGVDDVKGIAYKKEKNIKKTFRKRVSDLDSLPFPAFDLFDVKKGLSLSLPKIFKEVKKSAERFLNKEILGLPHSIMILSSIGCTYSCSFCPMSGVKDSSTRYREHSPEYFVSMLQHFRKIYDHNTFVFGDNFFTKDKKRTEKICNLILRRKLDIKWNCMTRTDYLDRQLIKKMKIAGCTEISFGVESCSKTVQDKTGKRLPLDSIKKAFDLCDKTGLRSVLMLMVGNQGDTKDTIYETLSELREINPDEVLIQKAKAYPGTKIHEISEEMGLIKDRYYLGSDPKAPLFLVEKTKEEIDTLNDMIHPRNLRFQLDGKCNNNCITCTNKKSRKKHTKEDIKKRILYVAKRLDTITFYNGDSLGTNDILEIIDFSKNMGINKINLMTNARMLSYKKTAGDLAKAQISKFIIPFLSLDKNTHDGITRCDGSFEQTRQGIKNIVQYAGKDRVSIGLSIIKSNENSLKGIARWLISLGIKEITISYRHLQDLTPQDLTSLRSRLDSLLIYLKENKVKFKIIGIPYCIIPKYKEHISEIHSPFDELLDINSKLSNMGEERRRLRKKKRSCNSCKHNNICEGFWK